MAFIIKREKEKKEKNEEQVERSKFIKPRQPVIG